MTDKSVWDKEIPVPERLIQYIDPGVLKCLLPGMQAQGISPSGSSYWARTAKIDATDASGKSTPLFIKVHQGSHGKEMVSSEWKSMKLLRGWAPEMVAEPMAWGQYTEEPEVYFFMCRYLEMSGDIPNVAELAFLVAELHKRAVGVSFGLPWTTYGGRNAQCFPSTKTWEECFTRGLGAIFDKEQETHGPDGEMQRLREGLVTKVIPRLLRPLETEGRVLKPRLVHGDLWAGNMSVGVANGRPVIFDGTPLYAHNEYELGPWWVARHQETRGYIAEYLKHFPASEPVEDFEDRGALYSLRFDLHSSSLYPGNLRFRLLAMDTMRALLEKYPLGYDGYKTKGGADNGVGSGL